MQDAVYRSKLVLQRVPIELCDRVLPHIVPRLASIVERSNRRLTLESIAVSIARGEYQLWLIGDRERETGVVLTEIYLAPSGVKVCCFRGVTGESSESWIHLIDDLEEWARLNGCQIIEGLARKGWAKKLHDYKLTHVLLEKDLD